jgi:uncharacterized damage-inducible protein DinB
MKSHLDPPENLVSVWRTTNRITIYLVENLSLELLRAAVPGVPRRTVRMIAGHIHNTRCRWIKTLGKEHGIELPDTVDRRRVGPKQLIRALNQSGRGIASLLALGCGNGGTIPTSSAYVWRNLPLDVGHVLAYFVAHEAHHRGQIVMIAHQLGHRFPASVTAGLWQWSKRAKESRVK